MTDESSHPSEKDLLVAKLTEVLGSHSEEQAIWQQEVLGNLSESLPSDLRQHLNERAAKGDTASEQRGQAAGFVFEALVRADNRLFDHPETAAAVELREVLKHSRRYHFDDPLLDFREPDVALVDERGEFRGYAEAKLGLLDTRALRQLSASGAKATFLRVTRHLRENYARLSEWGLPALAAKPKREIAIQKEGFARVLVVPSNRNIASRASLIKASEQIGQDDRERAELLRVLNEEVTVCQTAFSTEEVWRLTDALLEKG